MDLRNHDCVSVRPEFGFCALTWVYRDWINWNLEMLFWIGALITDLVRILTIFCVCCYNHLYVCTLWSWFQRINLSMSCNHLRFGNFIFFGTTKHKLTSNLTFFIRRLWLDVLWYTVRPYTSRNNSSLPWQILTKYLHNDWFH
jgi:hypothetical protein